MQNFAPEETQGTCKMMTGITSSHPDFRCWKCISLHVYLACDAILRFSFVCLSICLSVRPSSTKLSGFSWPQWIHRNRLYTRKYPSGLFLENRTFEHQQAVEHHSRSANGQSQKKNCLVFALLPGQMIIDRSCLMTPEG